MVSLSEYATVDDTASLYEAVLALEKSQNEQKGARYPHRAVLILDKSGQVIGKLSQTDVLRALEPKYEEMQERSGLAMYGFSRKFMKSLLSNYQLWNSPLEDICAKAGEISVARFMKKPTEGEYIDEDASLDEAIHQLIFGYHQSLLVCGKDDKVSGILKLSDVFASVSATMKACNIKDE